LVNGVPLDFDVQPGTGAVTAGIGGWYANYKFPWMVYTSAMAFTSNEGFQQFQAGDAITLNLVIQYAVNHKLSLPLALEGRWSKYDEFGGVTDPNSGGTQVYIAPGLIYTLHNDLLLNLAFKLPVVENLHGDHEEGNIYTVGVTYDFDIH
jgi:hypothetical protein